MKLERIELENFRPYFARQQIEFSTDPERRVTVLRGVNGAGKTSLFMALNWCLYDQGVEGTGELPCKRLLETLREGKRETVRVSLWFDAHPDRYRAERSLEVVKRDGQLVPTGPSEFFLYKIKETGDAELDDGAQATINQLLPSTARSYFFFDAEKIDQFARAGNEAEVKAAVREVLGLRLVEKGAEHLHKVANQIRRQLQADNSVELSELLRQQEEEQEERDTAHQQLGELEEEKALADKEMREVEEQLRNFHQVTPLMEQRDRFTAELRGLEQEVEAQEARQRALVSRAAMFWVAGPLQQAQEILDGCRQRGEIPSAVRERFLQDLLDNQECICGTQLLPGSSAAEVALTPVAGQFSKQLAAGCEGGVVLAGWG